MQLAKQHTAEHRAQKNQTITSLNNNGPKLPTWQANGKQVAANRPSDQAFLTDTCIIAVFASFRAR
jgi:hypothetical protein